jgi:hypothetical protein
MNELIKYAKRLIKENKVQKIGGPGSKGQLYEVGEHSVRIFTKPGRTLYSCTCYNGTRFCNESPFCVHKLAVIIYEVDKKFREHMDKIISDYQKFNDAGIKKMEIIVILDDLNKLREMLWKN